MRTALPTLVLAGLSGCAAAPVPSTSPSNCEKPATTPAAPLQQPAPEPEDSNWESKVGSPWPADLAERCEPLSVEVDDKNLNRIPRRLLAAFIPTARTSQDAECVQEFVARHFPAVAKHMPVPASAQGVKDWYDTLGGWLTFVEPPRVDQYVVTPQAPRAITDVKRLGQLAPLLCTDNECGFEARSVLKRGA